MTCGGRYNENMSAFTIKRNLLIAIISILLFAVITASWSAPITQTGNRANRAVWAEIAEFSDKHGWSLYGERPTLFHVDSHHHWRDVTPKGFRALARKAAIGVPAAFLCGFYSLDGKRAWLSINDGTLSVCRTTDGGAHWRVASLKPATGGSNQYIDFANRLDGGMLVVSDPASHQMEKAVYRTTDGGRSWRLMSYASMRGRSTPGALSNVDFPTGLTVRTATDFWTATDGSLGPTMPLYHSTDGGRTWRLVRLATPWVPRGDELPEFDIYPPKFWGPSSLHGDVHVFEHSPKPLDMEFWTSDGGRHWRGPVHVRLATGPN